MAADFSSDVKHDFDLEIVHKRFQNCQQSNGQLSLSEYIAAYNELNRFFRLSGRLFGFVAKDLEDKTSNIDTHMRGPNKQYYNTIQSMVEFETENDLIKTKRKLPSGTRSLLHLHHGLEFILNFMDRLSKSNDDDKSSVIAADVYKETLSKHHPWIVQKMAGLAMYMLPSRRQLLETMCKHDYDQSLHLLKKVVQAGFPVYDCTQNVFADKNLLSL